MRERSAMSILQLFVCSQRKNGNKMATEKGKQENVEHVVIAAWPAEGRAGTGNRRWQLTVGSTRCLGILGEGPDTDPASCTNYAHTHCCRTLRVEGLLHVINYPNRLRQIDLNRNQTTAAAPPPSPPPCIILRFCAQPDDVCKSSSCMLFRGTSI